MALFGCWNGGDKNDLLGSQTMLMNILVTLIIVQILRVRMKGGLSVSSRVM